MKNETNKIISSILSFIIALIFGAILLVLLGQNPFYVFQEMITYSFRDVSDIADFLNKAIPLILCGYSIALAYKTGLFNIGAEGQFLVGVITAIFVGTLPINNQFHPYISLISGMIAGGLYGMIPGLLKAYFKVNEVVSSILLNLIALKGVSIIVQYWFHGPKNSTATPSIQQTASIQITDFGLTLGIFIVLIVAILYHVILKETKFGFEIMAVGNNQDAANYAGINVKQKMVQTMFIAGMFAGIAGAIYGLELNKFSEIGHNLNYGFNGIVVAMLGNLSTIGIIISGLIIGCLNYMGTSLTSIPTELIDIIIGIIFIFTAIASVYTFKFRKKRRR